MATIKSIEEKAKAYDEALSVARKTHQTQPMYRDWLEKMFPELAESEEERIRKELIKQVVYIVPNDDETDNEGNVLPTYQQRIDRYIAWLEKQGEKKDILEDAILDSNEDGLIAETIKVGKAKKSQRIVSAEAKEAMYDKPAPVRTGPIGFDGEPMESKPCEQKPAWSEEDESVINLLKDIAEEQEKDYCPYNANNLRKAAQYLETCRLQNTWKPSDEQMKMVDEIINVLSQMQLFGGRNALIDLKHDLEKLREE